MRSFRDYTSQQAKYITFVESDFYPDNLEVAVPIYATIIDRFGELLGQCSSSVELLESITMIQTPAQRIQLLRVFRKYISPDTSVEMLKKKKDIPRIIREFGSRFRNIQEAQERFASRAQPDEALIAVLDEYRKRGQKGYILTETFFDWFETHFADRFTVSGPVGAGKDINMNDLYANYPKDRRPIDFVITECGSSDPLVIGLARYDTDRGGAQEDDRTGGYRGFINEVLNYSAREGIKVKILLLNDGPGLLLGSMWRDYCELEEHGRGYVMVATLKMLEHRLTEDWIRW
ncbi:MAG: hypothetical protein IT210_03395 [Armatimonadetes bacterium]|nr:hypothetical protein [Armatimonadota bacterium]